MEIVDQLAIGGKVENLPVKHPVAPDFCAEHCARPLQCCTRHRDRTESADLLKWRRASAYIFQIDLWHDPALVQAPVVAELDERTVELGAVVRGGEPKAGVAPRCD